MRSLRLIALLGVTLLVPASLAAQQERPRVDYDRVGRLWAEFGGAQMKVNVTCDDATFCPRSFSGTGYHVGLGWGLTSRIRLSGEISGLYRENGDATHSALFAQVYPTVRGLYVKAGAAYSKASFSSVEAGDSLPTAEGLGGIGFVAGVGYDVPLGAHFALTPSVTYRSGSIGTLNRTDLVTGSAPGRNTVLSFGVAINWTRGTFSCVDESGRRLTSRHRLTYLQCLNRVLERARSLR